MKIKMHIEPSSEKWPTISRRPSQENDEIISSVRSIIEKVKKNGDKALRKLTLKFDGVKVNDLLVSPSEIDDANPKVDETLKRAIEIARNNIGMFHRSQVEKEKVVETMQGIKCWRKNVAIDSIGIYIPGGTAPLFSTILMLAIPAQIAGCREITLCTPPGKNNEIHPVILYVASLLGIRKIFRVGGAQAIAAMAYGTGSIPKVNKIFGPGNQFVTVAKQLVQKDVAIDMPAGPSEVLVIADNTAVPSFVAADLLAQAEHGTDSQVVLVTTSIDVAKEVMIELNKQLDQLPRKAIAKKALKNSHFVVLSSLSDAIAFSNQYAPEHLILCCSNNDKLADEVVSAGSVFLGNYSPESAGDYASGTNHTLPTSGFAGAYSGVSIDSFVKKITFQEISEEGLKNISEAVIPMAEAEGLQAHSNSISIRLT